MPVACLARTAIVRDMGRTDPVRKLYQMRSQKPLRRGR
jgi:hypothetical protein